MIDVTGRLLSVASVGIGAGVGSVGDLHTGPERFGESDPLRTWRVMNAHHGWSSSALPGAGGGTRTHTPLRTQHFECCTSAYSVTPAGALRREYRWEH